MLLACRSTRDNNRKAGPAAAPRKGRYHRRARRRPPAPTREPAARLDDPVPLHPPVAPRRRRALAFIAVAAFALPPLAHAADEHDTGGLFSTPGYPRRATTPSQGGNGLGPTSRRADARRRRSAIAPAPAATGPATRRTATRTRDGPRSPATSLAAPHPSRRRRRSRTSSSASSKARPGGCCRSSARSFFADAADNFQSLDNVPVSADYTIGPGDEIVTRAWGSIDVDYRSTVDRNGMLNLPKVGSFNVAGVKAADLEKNLRAQIGRLFTNFDLSVSLGQLRGLRVFIVGPAQRPGVVTLSSQSTLLSAVVAAGGPSPSGSMRKILLRRDGQIVSELDVYDFLVQGDKSKDVQLVAGDVVVFQPAGPRVALTGAIDTPAIYELKSAEEPIARRAALRRRRAGARQPEPGPARAHRSGAAARQALRRDLRASTPAGLQKPLRDGDVRDAARDLAAVRQRGDAEGPRRAAAALSVHAGHAHSRPDPRSRRAHHARLLPAQEPARAGDRGRRSGPPARRVELPRRRATQPPQRQRLRAATSTAAARRERSRDRRTPTRAAPTRRATRNRRATRRRRASADGRGATTPAAAAIAAASRSSIREPDRSAAMRARRTPAALFDELNWDYATIERLNPDLTTQVIAFNLGKASCSTTRPTTSPWRRATSSPSTARRTCACRSRGRPAWCRSKARSTRPASTSCSRARR